MDVPSYKSWFPRFTISLVWACDGCSKKGIVCPNNPHFSWTLFRFWSSVFKKIVFKKIFVEFLLENHNPKYLCSFGHPKMYVRRFFEKSLHNFECAFLHIFCTVSIQHFAHFFIYFLLLHNLQIVLQLRPRWRIRSYIVYTFILSYIIIICA